MRNMSFALTTRQYQDGSKDVTRRLGWASLKPGEHFMGVLKGMGLKKGEKITKLGEAVCISNFHEQLDYMTEADCKREGFPEMTAAQFVEMFCKHNKCLPSTMINRIEFKRLAPKL